MHLVYMMVSICLYAAVPTIITLLSFDFPGLLYVAGSMVMASLLLFGVVISDGTITRARLGAMVRLIQARHLALFLLDGVSNGLSFLLVYYAITRGDGIISATVYEVWPVLIIFILPFFVRKEGIGPSQFAFALVALVGVVLVGIAKSREVEALSAGLQLHITVLAALAAAALMAVSSAAHLANTHRLVPLFRGLSDMAAVSEARLVAFVSWGSRLVTALLFVTACLVMPPQHFAGILQSSAFWFLCASIGIVAAFGSVFFGLANQKSDINGINMMWSIVPVLAVLFLVASGQGVMPRPLFFIGGIFILSANLAISLQSDVSVSYKVALFVLPVWAAACFFFPGTGDSGYFDAVALPVSIFAILVAFMIDRVARKREMREHLFGEVFRCIETTVEPRERPLFRRRVLQVVSATRPHQIEYRAMALLKETVQRYPDLAARVFDYVNATVRLHTFGQVFVLWLLAIVTLSVSFFARPDTVFADILCVGLNTSIVYLCLSVFDQGNQRRDQYFGSLVAIWRDLPGELDRAQTLREHRSFVFQLVFSTAFVALLFLFYALAVYLKDRANPLVW